MKKYICVRTQFAGFHCWPNAPQEVAFLQLKHRHIFHVQVKIEVQHNDRELEFFMVKAYLDSIMPTGELGPTSCEMLAEAFITQLQLQYGKRNIECQVFEDGENGAIVESIV